MELEFVDGANNVIDSDLLPLVPPDLALIDPYDPAEATAITTGLALVIDLTFVRARWDTLSASVVPEPSAGTLIGLGTVAIAGCRRVRRSPESRDRPAS